MRSGIVCGWMVAASLFAAQSVRVNVIAPPGLAARDFRVTDDGVPQVLTSATHSTAGQVAVFVDRPTERMLRLLRDAPPGLRMTVFLWDGVGLRVRDGGRPEQQTPAAGAEAVAEQMARLVAAAEGWRAIVWISDRYQFGSAPWSTARLVGDGAPPRGPMAVVNRAGIALYPVDLSRAARGEMPLSDSRPVPGAQQQEWNGEPRPNPLLAPTGPMNSAEYLAAITGGTAFRGTGGIRAALRQVARDARSSYALVFEPGHAAAGGNLHRLRVQARGKLRYRSLYFDARY